MSLTCHCSNEYDFYYMRPKNFTTLRTRKRKRCSSCKTLICRGTTVLIFNTWREPKTDIEERIYRGEVPMARKYMCEKCGDQFMNLSELGFCIDPTENMFELLQDYQEIYGRQSK